MSESLEPRLDVLPPSQQRLWEELTDSNSLKIASMLDLAGMKAAVVQKRAEAKDYIDIDAIITNTDIDLPMMLSAGRAIYGQGFNPEITLKALSYYGEGNLQTLTQEVRDRLAAAVNATDLNKLPSLGANNQNQESGYER